MATHLNDVLEHEMHERRNSTIYFVIIALAAILGAAMLLWVLR